MEKEKNLRERKKKRKVAVNAMLLLKNMSSLNPLPG